MSNFQLYMNLGIVVITIIVFVVMVTKTKMKEDKEFARKQRRKKIKRFFFYRDNFITRGTFRHISSMYASLQCYDDETVKAEAVSVFERSLIISCLMPVVALVLMKDTFIALTVAIFAYVFYNNTTNVKYDKLYVDLMRECSLCIASIREKYMETESIPTSVLYAEHDMMIDAPLKTIYKMLTSVDQDRVRAEFIALYPVPIIKTLGNLCYILNDEGVERRSDGSDSFTESLTVLRQECDAEVRRLTKQKIAFNSLTQLTLVGLFVDPIAEMYLLNMIPGTASLLKGYYGFVLHIAVVLITAISYYYVSTACRPSVTASNDRQRFVDDLRTNSRYVRDMARKLRPKTLKDKQYWRDLIDGALSSQDLEYIYTAKLMYVTIFAFLATLGLVFGTITVRSNFYNNYKSLSFIPTSVKESQQLQLNLLDDEIMSMSKKDWATYNNDKEALVALVKGRVTGINDSEASTQADRIKIKYNGYHGAVFHWWWPLVIYVVGMIGWFLPNIFLMIRKNLVQYEANIDVSQLQTIMIVLSETKMDVYRVICWLQEQATVHESVLRDCRVRYIANPEAALQRLEDSTPEHDFKRLIRQLKSAVYNLSLQDAFSGLKLDKQQSMSINEMLRTEEIEQRKNSAKLIAIAPAAVALIGAFVGPVLILGITQMTDTLAQLQGFG